MNPVDLQDVALSRGSFRLDIPSLVIERGLVVGLVGRNGSGKTTLLELLSGLLAPDRGTVSVFGIEPTVAGDHEPPELGDELTVKPEVQFVGTPSADRDA